MPFSYGCVTIQKYASEIIEFIKHKVVMMAFFKVHTRVSSKNHRNESILIFNCREKYFGIAYYRFSFGK